MFCMYCGKEIPEKVTSVGFCPFCGKTLPRHQDSGQEEMSPIGQQSSAVGIHEAHREAAGNAGGGLGKAAKVFLAALGLLVILAIFSRVFQQQSVPDHPNPLPISRADLMAAYNPPPQLIAVKNEGSGHTVEVYQGKFHQLELEEEAGQLVRAAMIFNKAELTNDPAAGLGGSFWMGIFVMRAGRIEANLKGWMEQLGLNNAWTPSPSQIVVNGVAIRRYMQGNSLILEAVSPASTRTTTATRERQIDSAPQSPSLPGSALRRNPTQLPLPQDCVARRGAAQTEVWCSADVARLLSDPQYQTQMCQQVNAAGYTEAVNVAQSNSSTEITFGIFLFASGTKATAQLPIHTLKGTDLSQIREYLRQGIDPRVLQSIYGLSAAVSCQKALERLNSSEFSEIDTFRSSREPNPTGGAAPRNPAPETQSGESQNVASTYPARLRSVVVSRGYQPIGNAWLVDADSEGNKLLIQQAACNNGPDGQCQKLFIAFNDRFLGTDTFLPSWAVHDIAQEDVGTFSAVYEDLSDPNRKPPPVKVVYTWDGRKLTALGTPPTRPTRP